MPDLTREEVERRLAKLHDTMALVPPLARNIHAVAEREALQTAQALYAERDAQTERVKRLEDMLARSERAYHRLADQYELLEAVAEAAEARMEMWTAETYADLRAALTAWREAKP